MAAVSLSPAPPACAVFHGHTSAPHPADQPCDLCRLLSSDVSWRIVCSGQPAVQLFAFLQRQGLVKSIQPSTTTCSPMRSVKQQHRQSKRSSYPYAAVTTTTFTPTPTRYSTPTGLIEAKRKRKSVLSAPLLPATVASGDYADSKHPIPSIRLPIYCLPSADVLNLDSAYFNPADLCGIIGARSTCQRIRGVIKTLPARLKFRANIDSKMTALLHSSCIHALCVEEATEQQRPHLVDFAWWLVERVAGACVSLSPTLPPSPPPPKPVDAAAAALVSMSRCDVPCEESS